MAILIFNLAAMVIVMVAAMALALLGPGLFRRAFSAIRAAFRSR